MRQITAVGLGVAMVAGLAAGMAPSAQAAETKDISGDELAGLVREAGYRATVERDSQGDPMVTSAAAGAQYSIVMYGCEKDRCKSLQFRAGFDLADGIGLESLDAWNREKRYGKAWRDDEGDPWLELDLDLEGGGSMGQVAEYVELWDTLLGQFQTHVNQRSVAPVPAPSPARSDDTAGDS